MSKAEPGPTTVFVISPIGSPGTADHRRYRLALDFIVRRALPSPKYEVVRADDEDSPDSISHRVIERIQKSDVVVANLTDQNPNVFYELAVAHGYKTPVVQLIEAGQKLPFDIIDQRAIFYDLTDPESIETSQARLLAAVQNVVAGETSSRNPLSNYEAFEAVSSAFANGDGGEVVAEGLAQVADAVERLARRVDGIDYRIRTQGTRTFYSDVLSARVGGAGSLTASMAGMSPSERAYLEGIQEGRRGEFGDERAAKNARGRGARIVRTPSKSAESDAE